MDAPPFRFYYGKEGKWAQIEPVNPRDGSRIAGAQRLPFPLSGLDAAIQISLSAPLAKRRDTMHDYLFVRLQQVADAALEVSTRM